MRGSQPVTNYIYHLYGDDEIFLAEASYSIGVLAKLIDPKTSRIILFTDRPERMRNLPVTCDSIADEIGQMRGPSGYGYRVKLCCILKCMEKYPGNVFYLDCDTIATRPPAALAAVIQPNRGFMYRQERLEGRFPQFDGFQVRLPDGRQYVRGPESRMFNAGAIGIHRDRADVIKDALVICDELLRQNRLNQVCEQFAVSESFRIAGMEVLEAHPTIAHYYRGSAKRYMHHKLAQAKAGSSELWNMKRPIPYSYPRVQLFKWFKVG